MNTQDICQKILSFFPEINDSQSFSFSTEQLVLLVAAFSAHNPPKQPPVVICNDGVNKSLKFSDKINAWYHSLNVNAKCHVITDQIAEQEESGLVESNLTETLHAFLRNKENASFVVPADKLEVEIPDPAAYQELAIRLSANARLDLREFTEKLVKIGYTPKKRGEQVDLSIAAQDGIYTVTFFGNTVEQIVHRDKRESKVLPRLTIWPNKFPQKRKKLVEILQDKPVLKPGHLAQELSHAIVYDALESKQQFLWQPVQGKLDDITGDLVVFYQNRDRVVEWLKHRKIMHAKLQKSAIAQYSLALASPELTFISEMDIFPQTKETKAVSHEKGMQMVAELKVGKPAVHADHGIAIYEGLNPREIDGQWREYLVLRFAENDTVSVPVEYAHKVTAYLGDTAPPLSKLGGTNWVKAKKKAKEDAAKLAQELLELAGKRAEKTRLPYQVTSEIEQKLDDTFQFDLTPDQAKTWEEIKFDLLSEKPMDRLVVGDVGFGKTEIAVRAAAVAVANGQQVAVLAPTTLLTQQHLDTFSKRLPDLKNKIVSLSRISKTKEMRAAREKIADGEAVIVIGTHAILSQDTTWKNLGLVIVDEEQRFGVKQKEHFKSLRSQIDILSLSATPIPRTLSMSLSGLKNLSIISTAPTGRQSVQTKVLADDDSVLEQAISNELKRSGQVYLVSPRVSRLAGLKARLIKLFPNATTAVAHGQLPANELARIMHQFDEGEVDVLIASSIIANGIDLPNANTIIVTGCTNFGLSDLYQLRGRVGRRERKGFAYFLFSQAKLSDEQKKRLAAVTEASRLGSGWSLAQRDLEIRGAGNLLGAEQSGSVNAVGLQMYLDLVSDASHKTSKGLDHREVDIQLPVAASIPPHYIADLDERARWYQNLSRSKDLGSLKNLLAQMREKYGPEPLEVQNLHGVIILQHLAAQNDISAIHSSTISPPEEKPFERLSIAGKDLPKLLQKVGRLGNWVVREQALTWDNRLQPGELLRELATLLT